MLLHILRDRTVCYNCIRDGEPRTATSTFTQLLISDDRLSASLMVMIRQLLSHDRILFLLGSLMFKT